MTVEEIYIDEIYPTPPEPAYEERCMFCNEPLNEFDDSQRNGVCWDCQQPPTHCAGCGIKLENPAVDDGVCPRCEHFAKLALSTDQPNSLESHPANMSVAATPR